MKRRVLTIAGASLGAGLLAVLVGALAIATVLAQTPTPTANPAQAFLAKVAKNLGIDQAKLEAAIKQAALDTIDEQQKAGKLTPEQAQRAKDRVNQNPAGLPFGPPLGPGSFGKGVPPGLALGRPGIGGLDDAASAIGIPADQLRTELRAGKSLAEVAAAHGVTRDQLIQKLTDAANKHIDDAVAAGKLTKDQADKVKAATKDRVTRLVDAKPGTGPARPFGPDKRGN
jgi:polyhydroxyalkanoate synthesis regulator phasin